MPPAPPAWQLTLARLDGALPFLSEALKQGLALASLRRLWRAHVRDYPFENSGPEHDPGLEAAELMRSWYASERREFLSWLSRRGPPPLAASARLALQAKGERESFTDRFAAADLALDRLDARLPSHDPVVTLSAWIDELRREAPEFLEGGSEVYAVGGRAFTRFAGKGAAWAASLALAVRPQLFGLGAAPIALAGVTVRELFREGSDEDHPTLLADALAAAASDLAHDLARLHEAELLGAHALGHLNGSSSAPATWRLIQTLGPLTRAELARALGKTKRTASQAVAAMVAAGVVEAPDTYGAVASMLNAAQATKLVKTLHSAKEFYISGP